MKKNKKLKTHFREEVCFRYDVAGRQGFAVSRKREPHGKNLLCKLTLGGAFSLAIEIKFWLRRVLTPKLSPIEKSTRFRVLFSIGGGGRARTYDLYHVKVAL